MKFVPQWSKADEMSCKDLSFRNLFDLVSAAITGHYLDHIARKLPHQAQEYVCQVAERACAAKNTAAENSTPARNVVTHELTLLLLQHQAAQNPNLYSWIPR